MERFKESVLNGPTFREIISKIEESALEGYMGWRKKLDRDSDYREIGVIRDYLNENGYFCGIKTEKKVGALGLEYYETYFVIDWNKK